MARPLGQEVVATAFVLVEPPVEMPSWPERMKEFVNPGLAVIPINGLA
jgi:hypothetical protein